MRQRYHRMEDQKPWGGLARNQDFAKGRGVETKVENVKRSKLKDVLS